MNLIQNCKAKTNKRKNEMEENRLLSSAFFPKVKRKFETQKKKEHSSLRKNRGGGVAKTPSNEMKRAQTSIALLQLTFPPSMLT